jgi:hypothetical protein
MAFQSHDFTLDETNRLTAAISATTAGTRVVGTVASIDLGQLPPAFNANASSIAPHGRFAVVVDWTICKTSALNEAYTVVLEGSSTSDFTNTFRLGTMLLGHSSTTGSATTTPPNSRRVFYCDNVFHASATDGAALATTRYVRLAVTPSGTLPSISVSGAWLCPL